MKYRSESLEETAAIAKQFIDSIVSSERAVCVALSGNLGSGKTTFVQYAGKFLGIEERMQSPTFVIMKTYRLAGQKFKSLMHIDAYRLESGAELERLGFTDILDDPSNLVFVEWPEHVEGVVPASAHTIVCTFIDEKTREIAF